MKISNIRRSTKTHELKIKHEYFEDVISGRKKFEIRKNDRDYEVGDILRLNEIADEDGNCYYTGDCYIVKITYITDYAQQDDYVVMGIEPIMEVGKTDEL